MEITFPGGVAVEASFDGFTVRTDQPLSRGGKNSAPSPFDLFLASLGTCVGYFVLRFCQERGLSTEGLQVTLETEKDAQKHRLSKVEIIIQLPSGFPDKYRQAIVLAANQCSVKKAILDPPEFEVLTR